MATHGLFSPSTIDDVNSTYGLVGPVAQTAVKEAAKAMEFTKDEYQARITPEVIETARDAIFAGLLQVTTGPRDEFESHCASLEYEVVELGSEHVEYVAWHTAPVAETVIAATYQNEPEAAVATLRRQAYGRIYRDYLD